MSYSDDQLATIDLGKKVARLFKHKDFQDVILETYINNTALTIGKSFDGDTAPLEAITHLTSFLQQCKDEAEIILQQPQTEG